MTADLSKYYGYAASLMLELGADATLVLVIGGTAGSGCAPALRLDRTDSSESRRRNSRIVRSMATMLELVASQLEKDVVKTGIPLEAPQ
jgi:hypothetical protein